MRVLAFLASFLFAVPALAVEVSGPARVIDGDTLEVGGQVIRLDGIDAPESGQPCRATDGRVWNCGAEATGALGRMVADGVTCRGSSRDRYDRLIATCFAAGREINADLVRGGHALAFRRYSLRYVPEEVEARQARAGLWAGSFEAPWDFRRDRWDTASAASPARDCPIKGNISASGRIYHTPYSRHYDRTRIDPDRGERWFCSEAEALAAGWRAPRG